MKKRSTHIYKLIAAVIALALVVQMPAAYAASLSDLIPFMLEIEGNRFEYEMNVLLESPRNGIKLIEEDIEVIYEDNNSGTHFHPIKDSYRIYKHIFNDTF